MRPPDRLDLIMSGRDDMTKDEICALELGIKMARQVLNTEEEHPPRSETKREARRDRAVGAALALLPDEQPHLQLVYLYGAYAILEEGGFDG